MMTVKDLARRLLALIPEDRVHDRVLQESRRYAVDAAYAGEDWEAATMALAVLVRMGEPVPADLVDAVEALNPTQAEYLRSDVTIMVAEARLHHPTTA